MLVLIQNELIKILRRPGTYIMAGMIILLVIGAGVLTKYNVSKNVYGDDWKVVLESENKNLTEKSKELNKGTLAYEKMQQTIAENQYRISNDLKPNSSVNTWTFVKAAQAIISVVGLCTIVIAASIVSSEFSRGTIKLIMIRPSSRWEVLLAKYLSVIIFGFVMLFLLFSLAFLFGLCLFGISGENIHLVFQQGKVIQENMVGYLIKSYLLSSVDLLLMSTMAFMISTVFRNNSLALGISLFSYLSGDMVTRLIAQKFDGAKYILFANTNLTMYTDGDVLVKGMTPTFSITILSLYLVFFLSVSFVSFSKRDIL
ncbi:ABC transporter permease [Bacillus thuringiensis]|uniref:ABC transporter permease n=1 Tax=Bacillus cereus group TaxID=86661 RepID=UPI000BED04CF|nr:ABC transporter permease [Bacillus thuringiensis]MCU5131754.1 ABC transporter permease [Bacillus cereus]MCU5544475.1 ABC transporter permease [Bacillus cereus]MED3528201.1 ABC transporter permease [Bacillus thuringiensis]PEA58516.1 hypothetical protein CON74_23065 [Bacillus thuringiensis]PFW16937.1 hypothetical protein COL22_01795 [Bacillus thuringiensis]